jgi:hypothetical protein
VTAHPRDQGAIRTHPDAGTTVEFRVQLKNGQRGRRRLREGGESVARPTEAGNVPRISRLVALAIKINSLIESGAVTDLAQAARLGHVSRARLSQIANLTLLAPSIIEDILNLPRTVCGRDALVERQIRPIAAIADWREQRRLWGDLRVRAGLDADGCEVA